MTDKYSTQAMQDELEPERWTAENAGWMAQAASKIDEVDEALGEIDEDEIPADDQAAFQRLREQIYKACNALNDFVTDRIRLRA